MKIILFVLISFFIGIINAQDTITINSDLFTEEYMLSILQNRETGVLHPPIGAITEIKVIENSSFRLLHSHYGNSLWTENSIINYIIDKYELNALSTDFDIVKAASLFNKDYRLQDNGRQPGNIQQINTTLWSYWSFYSTHCGEHRNRAASIVQKITKHLSIDKIDCQSISLEGHQTFQYFDKEYQKWIFVDPDPGNGILFISDGNGHYASIDEITEKPELILSPKTELAPLSNTTNSVEDERLIYYKNMVEIFLAGPIETDDIEYIYDSRDIYFNLPKGTKLEIPHTDNKSLMILKYKGLDTLTIMTGIEAMENGDAEGWWSFIKKVADYNNLNYD